MSDSLVTVAQFHGSNDAAQAKNAMDSAGIEAAVEDVRLEVHNEDAYRAFTVLDAVPLPVVEEAYETPHAKTCPTCASTDIAPTRRLAAFSGIAALGLGIGVAIGLTDAAFFAVGAAALFLLMSDRWTCEECGATWN